MRCEGYRRHGGAFTLGPVRWEQCKNEATVNLDIKQDGDRGVMPACHECWLEAVEKSVIIYYATPIQNAKRKTKKANPRSLA